MATYTIGTASGGYYNNRGSNTTPYNYGSSFTVPAGQTWAVSAINIQMAGNGSTQTVFGHIWNSSGTDYWQGAAVSIASDTTPAFPARTLTTATDSPSYASKWLAPGTWYVGFSKTASHDINWDAVNATSNTATGNTVNGNLSDFSPPSALARSLVGTMTYTSYTTPSAPTSVTSTPNNGSITVSFGGPTDTGGGVSYYQYSTDNATWSTVGSNPFNVNGTNGTAITVYVRAVTIHGPGASASTTNTPRTIPTAPTSFAASNATFGELVLSWAAPSSDGGDSVDGYRLRTGTTLGAGTLLYEGTGTSYAHTGLSPYTDYSYNIVAYNAAGESTDTTNATLTAKTMGGIARVWNGSSWVTTLPKIWNGTAWVDAQARMWNGTEWKYGI